MSGFDPAVLNPNHLSFHCYLITHNFPLFNRVWLDQERALREMSRSPVLLPMDDSSTANVSLLKLDLHNIGLVTKYQLLVYQFIWVL